MATVGQQLTAPEAGWIRYDDSDSRMIFAGPNWISGSGFHADNTTTSYVVFKFYGTKLRILGNLASNASTSVSVNLDGNVQTYNEYIGGASQPQTILYEKTGLTYGLHTVKVYNNLASLYYAIDAIDIDSTGKLVHPILNEKTDLPSMNVGDCIACEYTASSGAFGTFANLGKVSKGGIPTAGTTTPDGMFYFIHAGFDYKGRIKLVADRNIQTGIAWDTLNAAGVATGSGLLVKTFTNNSMNVITRLLTGGVSSADTDNEWDKIIVNSTLNGIITAGDNNIWNWNCGSGANSYSYTSTTNTAGNVNRTVRGNTSLTLNSYSATSYGNGYRPVLIVEILGVTKYLFKDGSDIKFHDGANWNIAGQYPVTEAMFTASGMNDLSKITDSVLRQLTAPTLLVYSTFPVLPTSLSLTVTPSGKLIKAVGDIDLDTVLNIKNFTLNYGVSGSGVIGVLASADSGSTWKAWDGTQWNTVNTANVVDVKAKMMTPSVFNTVPQSAWSTLVIAKKIRFAYYIEMAASTDTAYTDTLTGQFDMQGQWAKAIHGTDYHYIYVSNDRVQIQLLSNGDFKINYAG